MTTSFQSRVNPWLLECFGEQIARSKEERNHRFLEESLELVQSTECTKSEAHQLVDYVFDRPQGDVAQEIGGVMVTLAALCLANGFEMHECGEVELARVWGKVEQIRAKQQAKPKHSPLPEGKSLGKLIAIEGIDGSGKGTQAQMLRNKLEDSGFKTRLIGFPRYKETLFGALVGEFLNGDFGSLQNVHPLLASLLYSLDRFESLSLIEQSRRDFDVVIFDRYSPSNIAHQASKVVPSGRLTGIIEKIEHGILGIPKPDHVLLLDVPTCLAMQNVQKKEKRAYTDKSADIQEADECHLSNTRLKYLHLYQENEDTWKTFYVSRPTTSGPEMRDVHEISEEIFAFVKGIIA